MELTDERIGELRSGLLQYTGSAFHRGIEELCDAALAHNAAKRQEPVAWIVQAKDAPTSPRYLLWEKEGVGMAQQHQCDYTPLYAAPPDLAAKLKEARELLEQVLGNPYAKQGLEQDIKHFLARTK